VEGGICNKTYKLVLIILFVCLYIRFTGRNISTVSLYVRVQDNYIFFFVDRSIESVNKKKMFDIVYRVCIYLVVEVR